MIASRAESGNGGDGVGDNGHGDRGRGEAPQPFIGLPERYLTGGAPGIGGRLKERPEDFFVEEIPLYEPSGSGEHLYLFIEKRGRPTLSVVRDLAGHFRVRPDDVGYAGMKDKQAITRQFVSVHLPGGAAAADRHGAAVAPDAIDVPGTRVLWADWHRNKLRTGHLRGNRFAIKIRGVGPHEVTRVARVLRRLESSGVPNFVGEQRFGYHANNHEIGRRYLLQDWQGMADLLLGAAGASNRVAVPAAALGDSAAAVVGASDERNDADASAPVATDAESRRAYDAGDFARAAALRASASGSAEHRILLGLGRGLTHRRAILAGGEPALRFYVSAFQSAVFNAVLARRMDEGTFDRLLEGDLAAKGESHAVFAVTAAELADPEIERRLQALEISPTGPLWGAEMMRAAGDVDRLELEALEATGVPLDRFDTPPLDVRGTRRSLRMAARDAQAHAGADEYGPYIGLNFELPRGGFATTVLREIMKTPPREHPWGS